MEEEKKVEETTKDTNIERKGFNVTALILGLISLGGCLYWPVSVPTGIIAIIFSIAGKKDAGRKMGIAGLILGIVGLAFCAVNYFFLSKSV